MKPVAFDYIAAPTLESAFEALDKDGAIPIAGGQSLGPMLNLRLVRPRILVDISRIPSLRSIEDYGTTIRIGACVTHSEIEDTARGVLSSVAAGISCRTVRNRGTIGGSVAHADPAGDWPLALSAIGATVFVRGSSGKRSMPVDKFLKSAFNTDLRSGELIEGFEIPKDRITGKWGYFKFCRRVGEFPEANAAVFIGENGKESRAFIGALNSSPKECISLRSNLRRNPGPGTHEIQDAVRQAAPHLDAGGVSMCAAAMERAIKQAFSS